MHTGYVTHVLLSIGNLIFLLTLSFNLFVHHSVSDVLHAMFHLSLIYSLIHLPIALTETVSCGASASLRHPSLGSLFSSSLYSMSACPGIHISLNFTPNPVVLRTDFYILCNSFKLLLISLCLTKMYIANLQWVKTKLLSGSLSHVFFLSSPVLFASLQLHMLRCQPLCLRLHETKKIFTHLYLHSAVFSVHNYPTSSLASLAKTQIHQ